MTYELKELVKQICEMPVDMDTMEFKRQVLIKINNTYNKHNNVKHIENLTMNILANRDSQRLRLVI